MAFESKWLNWRKKSDSADKGEEGSFVSSVSSSNIGNAPKIDPEERKNTFKGMPYRQNSEISPKVCFQRTDKTDRTPDMPPTLNGHRVARVIWETDKALVFEDEHGRFWRHLRAHHRTWPVLIDGTQTGELP